MKRSSRQETPTKAGQMAAAPPAALPARPACRRIALVTEELSSSSGSGGIGGAFHELAVALARAGHMVDIVFAPLDEQKARRSDLQTYYSAHGIRVLEVPFADYVWPPLTAERKAYGLFCYLRSLETAYDTMHFHDYKGLGFYILAAKQQRLGFMATTLVVQTHGPTRWTLEANGHPFSHEDQLKIDFMERESIARADVLVSPSQYLVDWLRRQGWQMPPAANVHVIQNVCTHLLGGALRDAASADARIRRFNEIVFFGRHEERKGIVEFCDAIEELSESLAESGTMVTFLGRFGEVNSTPSALYLARRAASWKFPLRMLPDCDRKAATDYLASRPGALIVVASPVENSPYAVLEAIVLGKPLITSSEGGARELLDARSAAAMTCKISERELASKIAQALREGLMPPQLRVPPGTTLQSWLDLHQAPPPMPDYAAPRPDPRVAVAIVTHDRPEKLVEAVLSMASQTYQNMEIVVVDDGSKKPGTQAALIRMQPLFEKLGVRLIRQPNLYLGAARNRAVRDTRSDYLLFLDDDDIAFPTMIQTLVTAAEATGAAVTNCLNLFMEENLRALAFPFPDRFEQKLSYLPLGGPASMAPLENCFGSATSLIRRDAFEAVGGYTEIYGVGHEDYELYVRMAQAGGRIDICPIPLYLYEVGRPSMISTTSRQKNFNRVATAIDFSHFSEAACADLVSLLAGKRAQEHTDNFRQYSISISPDSDLLRQILSTPTDIASYPELVAAYARNFGGEQYPASLLQLAAARAAASQQKATGPARVAWPVRVPKTAPVVRMDDTLMLGALVDMQCGRTADAVAGFLLSLERREALGTGGLRLLKTLADSRTIEPSLLGRLNEALNQLPIPDAEFTAAALPLFSLALKARDPEMLFAVSERALKQDEDRYLADYADVAEAVRDGAFPSGLTHFSTRKDENRTGFALSSRLAAALSQKGAEPAPAESLRGLVLNIMRSAGPEHVAPAAMLLAAE